MPPGRPWPIRVALTIVRLAGTIVPRRDRAGWRQEWEGEIIHRERAIARASPPPWEDQMSLIGRSIGSLSDAAWLRRQFTRDSEWVADLRHGVRVVRARPVTFTTAIAVLAFAIGATAATGSAVYHFVLRALPYPDAHQLVTIWQSTPSNPGDDVAPANFVDWRDRSQSFAGVAAIEPWSVDLVETGDPEVLFAVKVTTGFFDVVGLAPALGRTFRADEFTAGRDRVVIVSDALWRRRFNSDRAIIGRRLLLDAVPHEVVGVMPPDFDLGLLPSYRSRDAWLPNVIAPDTARLRGGGWWNVIARVKPGQTVAGAQAELAVISTALAREYPRTNTEVTARVTPLRSYLLRQVNRPLVVLATAVALVLLVACANVANLLLTAGVERTREMAVRGALGASRARLVRQLATESVVITGGGVIGGVAIAVWLLPTLASLIPATVPRVAGLTFDGTTIAIAGAAALVALLVCGVAPAVLSSRSDPETTLRDARTSTGTRSRRRVRDALATAQLALALILITGAGLLLRSFVSLARVDPGFTSERVLALQVFAWDHQPTADARRVFFEDTIASIAAVPGVTHAGAVSAMPFIESHIGVRSGVAVEGQPPPTGRDAAAFVTVATPYYFDAMRIPLHRGRFLSRDDRDRTVPVAVISQTAERRFWSGADALGGFMSITFEGRRRRVQVVGVVGDIRHDDLASAPRAEVYLPHAQAPFGSMTYVVRAAVEPAQIVDAVKARVWQAAPSQTFYDVQTLDRLIERSVTPQRLGMTVVGLVACVALFVAAFGVYGVMSFTTSLRTQEIGVRMALGAGSREIVRLVLGHGVAVVAIGVALGLAGAALFGRLFQGLLFAVSPRDPVTLVAGAGLVAILALVASWLPARRASHIDPVAALRD